MAEAPPDERAEVSGVSSKGLSDDVVRVKSSDDQVFVRGKSTLSNAFLALRDVLEDASLDEVAVNVKGSILEKVLEYASMHFEGDRPDEDLNAFDKEFLAVDHFTLFDITNAANELQCQKLVDRTCSAVADMIKGSSFTEIVEKFGRKHSAPISEEDDERIRECLQAVHDALDQELPFVRM